MKVIVISSSQCLQEPLADLTGTYMSLAATGGGVWSGVVGWWGGCMVRVGCVTHATGGGGVSHTGGGWVAGVVSHLGPTTWVGAWSV